MAGPSRVITQTGLLAAVFHTGIYVDPHYSLRLSASAELNRALVLRLGLPAKPQTMEELRAALAQWGSDSSVGVRIVGSDAKITDSLVVGFNTPIVSDGHARGIITSTTFDGYNGIDIQRSGDSVRLTDTHANNVWAHNLDGHYAVWSATPASGGSRYSAGDLLTVEGGICTKAPNLTVASVLGGAISEVTVTDPGDCVSPPGNPVHVSGGMGSGATFELTIPDASYRPGVAYKFHNRVDGGMVLRSAAINYQVCMLLDGVFGMTIDTPACEGGRANMPLRTIGLLTRNCVSAVTVLAPYIDTEWRGMLMGHRASRDGGNCLDVPTQTAGITIVGGHVGAPLNLLQFEVPDRSLIEIAPHSSGSISGTVLGGPGFPRSVIVDGDVDEWTFANIVRSAGTGITRPWIEIAASSIAHVSITPDRLGDGLPLPNDTILYGSTAGTIEARLTSDAAVAGPSNCVNIPPQMTYGLSILLQGRDTIAEGTYTWSVPIAQLSRMGSAIRYVALGAPIVLFTGTGAGATASASADSGNFCLNLRVRQPNGDRWNWTALVHKAVAF